MSIETKEGQIEEKKIDVSEDVDVLFNGEELSEEFKSKAKAIFEAAVHAKVEEQTSALKEEFDTQLVEQSKQFAESLVEKIDDYLEYVVSNWMEENKLAIDYNIKSEMSEDFMVGLKNLFTEHYVDIPEEKVDALEEFAEKVNSLEEELDQAITIKNALSQEISEYKKERISIEVSENLSEIQYAKLKSLAEHIEYISEEDYREKLQLTKKKYFGVKEEESISENRGLESAEGLDESFSPSMDRYVQRLSQLAKKS